MGERGRFKGHFVTVMVLGAVALVVLAGLLKLSGFLSVGGTYKVQAIVPQAGSLTQGTSVTMAGVRVGTVLNVKRRGVGALVNIRIDDKDVAPLPENSVAQLGVRTPLGENYVEILPGDAKRTLKSDGLIQTDQQSEYVDVDQILSVLRGKTRASARNMIGGLARAVDGEGENLNTTLDHTAGVLHSGSALTATLYPDRERIARLVDQLGSITREIGDREGSIRAVATQGTRTFQAVASRDDDLRALLDVLPSTLRQVKTTTGTLGTLSDTGSPVIANLATALRGVEPAVTNLGPAAVQLRGVLTAVDAGTPLIRPTLASVTRLAPRIVPALPKVRKVLCETNPGLRYIRPYTRDFLSLIEGFGSATNAYDAIGHTIRLEPVFGENSAVGQPDAINAAGYQLVDKGLLAGSTGVGFRPYPKPGQANEAVSAGDKYGTPQEFAAGSGYRYPHITSDC